MPKERQALIPIPSHITSRPDFVDENDIEDKLKDISEKEELGVYFLADFSILEKKFNSLNNGKRIERQIFKLSPGNLGMLYITTKDDEQCNFKALMSKNTGTSGLYLAVVGMNAVNSRSAKVRTHTIFGAMGFDLDKYLTSYFNKLNIKHYSPLSANQQFSIMQVYEVENDTTSKTSKHFCLSCNIL